MDTVASLTSSINMFDQSYLDATVGVAKSGVTLLRDIVMLVVVLGVCGDTDVSMGVCSLWKNTLVL